MSKDLVVQKNRLLQTQNTNRAAQYVRMSTDRQQYSIENQAAVIAAYAELHNLNIVRTYRDEGESGLTINNRKGLIELINEVQSNHADFGHLLIFDISRWGRFQDVDESAHYEFICRKAGVKVTYCAEQFDNDGSLLSSIMKNIKRVMAAEFSRELSAKVHAGAVRIANKGFRMGGREPFGLMRQLVDDKCRPKGTLQAGERKSLATDRVRLVPGPKEKVDVVRWIFAEYLRGTSQRAIARELNRRGASTTKGRPWCQASISTLLRREAYIGNLIYNRQSLKLGAKRTNNPSNLWVRSDGAIQAIVDREVFERVKELLRPRLPRISEEDMLVRLRKFLKKEGKLSSAIIDAAPALPSVATYLRHFGTLRNLYRMIGYVGNQSYWDRLDTHKQMVEVQLKNAAVLQEAFKKRGRRAIADLSTHCLQVDDVENICFRVATCLTYVSVPSKWQLIRRIRWPAGWVVAVRLAEDNKAILDYVLMPSTSVRFQGRVFCFSEVSRASSSIERFDTFEDLSRVLVGRVTRRSSQSKPGGQSRSGPKRRAKPVY